MITQNKERKYFIDWLRIGLILSVFIYHVGMVFNSWGWHVKSPDTLYFLEPVMRWLHFWRMPLLFLVSGVGTYYALGYRTTFQYLKERYIRLMVPFTVGLFLLVPVQVYIEKIADYTSLADFYTHMFEGIYPAGNFSWHHLWFILYLFLISLLISPLIAYFRSEHFAKVKAWMINKTSATLGLNWLIPILLISQYFLRIYYPESTNALMDDWAYFFYYVIFFLAGFILFTSDKLINALKDQRRLYLYQTIGVTLLFYNIRNITQDADLIKYLFFITEISLAWSAGMTALGYAKKYINKDSKFRKPLNAAIYPFYLLHQPAIVIIAYYVIQFDLPVLLQVIFVLFPSLIISGGLYWFVIRKINFLRIIFGLKALPKNENVGEMEIKEQVTNG